MPAAYVEPGPQGRLDRQRRGPRFGRAFDKAATDGITLREDFHSKLPVRTQRRFTLVRFSDLIDHQENP
jgi:hypothetical protein